MLDPMIRKYLNFALIMLIFTYALFFYQNCFICPSLSVSTLFTTVMFICACLLWKSPGVILLMFTIHNLLVRLATALKLYLLMSSADNLGKQLGPRCLSGLILFQTVGLSDGIPERIFKNVDFEKQLRNSRRQKKNMKNYPVGKDVP